ncbi:Receptor-type guanylate cyclase gcy [Seminavis robusta]|uniref:Receptor-type guanylate cyclase gcy n=1 Tax=Seminavis robusta TaxID=568900 RepID=A0A9N8EI41_9STRA|nr:Receptor-type guanylate cyclase gcy [Seminavis robusta]|eukprot:Sro1036_g234040.1 Receptor-type guanylate cyclase gcy (835) ;mRNA; r:14559-17677
MDNHHPSRVLARDSSKPIDKDTEIDITGSNTESHRESMHLRSSTQRRGAPPMVGRRVSLTDIFPENVAQAFKDGTELEPTQKECATIYFSDIVDYTEISATLPPSKVADMLRRLYKKLDRLAMMHDVYKVETINDAFLAVANLVKDQEEDHAKRIAEFAVDAVAAAKTIPIDEDNEDRGFLNIRVGFHSGPVCAAVLGTINPKFSLYGDTVNTASRMESNGEPGRIHCSIDSAKLLKQQCPDMPIYCRGAIEVKGKGSMQTFWVNEENERPSHADSMPKFSRQTSRARSTSPTISRATTRESSRSPTHHEACRCDPPKHPERRGSLEEDEATFFHEATCQNHHNHTHRNEKNAVHRGESQSDDDYRKPGHHNQPSRDHHGHRDRSTSPMPNFSRETSRASSRSPTNTEACQCDPPKHPHRRGSLEEEDEPTFYHETTCPQRRNRNHTHRTEKRSSHHPRESQSGNDYKPGHHNQPSRDNNDHRDHSRSPTPDLSRQSGHIGSSYANVNPPREREVIMPHDIEVDNSRAMESFSRLSIVSDITEFTADFNPHGPGGDSRQSFGPHSHHHDGRQQQQQQQQQHHQIPGPPSYQQNQSFGHNSQYRDERQQHQHQIPGPPAYQRNQSFGQYQDKRQQQHQIPRLPPYQRNQSFGQYQDERQQHRQIHRPPANELNQTWHPSFGQHPQPQQIQRQSYHQQQYQPPPPPSHHMQQPYHAPPPTQYHTPQTDLSHIPVPPHHPMTQQYQTPRPPQPQTPANNPLKVEIEPGVFRTLRGKDETLYAMECRFMIDLSCMVCTINVSCIADAEFVLCPVCKSVSPIVKNTGNGGGVGLGVEPD